MIVEGLANYLGQYKEALSDEEPMMDLKALWNRYKEGSKAIDDLKTAMTVTKNDKKSLRSTDRARTAAVTM